MIGLVAGMLPLQGTAGTARYQVAVSRDDSATDNSGGNCTTCSQFYAPYTTSARRAFMRWKIDVPKGATITSARLHLQFDAEGSTDPSIARIQAVDLADCPDFMDNPYDWAVAPEYTDWSIGAMTIGQWSASADIGPIIQAFIDRPDYEYGNGLGLRTDHVSGSWKRARTWDYGDHSAAPELEIHYTGGEVTVELWMAEPHVRLAQKIYVQLGSTEPTDRLLATLDGETICDRHDPLSSEEIFTADYRSLEAGSHTLRVEVRDHTGTLLLGAAEKRWTQVRTGIPKVGIDENNAICTNGVPFFPVTPWGVEGTGVADWLPYINMVHHQGWNTERSITGWNGALGNALSYGVGIIGPLRGAYWPNGATMPVYEDPVVGSGNVVYLTKADMDLMGNYINATKDHPALFMWGWKDEPDLGGGDTYIPATEVRRWTDKCHELDGHHPHTINIVGYGFTYGEQPNWHSERAQSYCFLFNDQANSTMGTNEPFAVKSVISDVISFDYYPYEMAAWDWVSLEDLALALDRLREWNHNLLPTMSCIETCDIDVKPGTPAPTASELHHLCWLSVIHGMKGLPWFHYFSETSPENYEVMRTFHDQITELTPVVLGPEEVGTDVTEVELGGGRIDIMTRKHNGNLYVFSCELRKESQSVQFNVDGLEAGTTISVYGEERTITAGSGSFTDSFDPLGVHIYEIPSPGSSGFLFILQ